METKDQTKAKLIELSSIIKNGMMRHLDVDRPAKYKWLLELPLTDEDYHRFMEIVKEYNAQ